MKPHHSSDERLARLLKEAEATPPAHGWERLEQHLNKEGGSPVRRRRLLPVLFSSVTAAAVWVLVFVLRGHPDAPQQMAQLQNRQDTPIYIGGRQDKDVSGDPARMEASPSVGNTGEMCLPSMLASAGSPSLRAGKTGRRSVRSEEKQAEYEVLPSYKSGVAAASVADRQPDQSGQSNPEKEEMPQDNAVSRKGKVRAKSNRILSGTSLPESRPSVSHPHRKPTVELAVSGTSRSEFHREGYVTSPAVLSSSSQDDNGVQASFSQILLKNVSQDVGSRISHKLPVTYRVSATWPLTGRFSLGTGLTYTQLRTDISSGTEENRYETSQQLHYIGVPLELQYDFLSGRRFACYATAGSRLEKCVYGKSRTDFLLNGQTENSTSSERVGEGLWQFSLYLSSGFEMRLAPSVGLYVEPGVIWYADDGGSLPTVRRDRPFDFSLQTGVRLRFR